MATFSRKTGDLTGIQFPILIEQMLSQSNVPDLQNKMCVPFTVIMACKILFSLKNKPSVGVNQVPKCFVENASPTLLPATVSFLTNFWLEESKFPEIN